jgi:uncharacterized membrane protein YccC
VLAADPGLGSVQAGWRALVSIIVALAVGWGMARVLGFPLLPGMTFAAVMALVSAFLVAENTAARLARSLLWMPVPYGGVLALASWVHPHWVVEQCLTVAVLALAFFLVRFGHLGVLTLVSTFTAFVFGVIVHPSLNHCGQFFLIAVATALCMLVARLLLCYPMPWENLLRTQRAFLIEARRVADAAAAALNPDADPAVAVKRMRRALRRLNITALAIDGHLAQPEVAADPHMAELLHQYLFDAELALQGIGQAIQQMADRPIDVRSREAMVIALSIVRDTHLGRADALRLAAELIRQQAAAMAEAVSAQQESDRALIRRVGDLLDVLADAFACWLELGRNSPIARARVPFQPTVALEGNRPAGAGPAGRRAAAAHDGPRWRRVMVHLRLPLHAAIAGAIVCPIADVINAQRFYWALISVLFTYTGTITTHDRLRRLGHRVVGTVIGSVIGTALLHLIGPGHIYWTLLVVVVAVALGIGTVQRRYVFFAALLTVAFVQLYGLILPPHTDMDWLLWQRVLDTLLGTAVAATCAAVIFPVSTRKVAREAQRGYLSALEQLIIQVTKRWKDPQAPVRLRAAARGVDGALFQAQSVIRPLIRMPRGVHGRSDEDLLALLGTATEHAHTLAAAADIDIDLAPHLYARLERIAQVFTDSLHALDQHIATGQPGGTWLRVSPMIRELRSVLHAPAGPRSNRLHIALRELTALDEVLAGLADSRGLTTMTVPAIAPATAPTAPPTPGTPADRAVRGTGHLGAGAAAHGMRHRSALACTDDDATSGGSGDRLPGRHAAAPHGSLPSSAGASAGTVTVSGTLRCPQHPDGCQAWITVVTDRDERRMPVKAVEGHYQVTGLAPGTYMLVVSGVAHAPRSEFLRVDRPGRDLRHDITLEPAS